MTTRLLLAVALPQENAGNRLDRLGHEILYTGVGKVNAAIRLAEALARCPRGDLLVVNLGSAGSHVFNAGEVVCATRFFERDMDATALGFALGQTPFEDETYLDYGRAVPGLPVANCYTGDSFVTERHPTLRLDVIDMEAYALAKTCHHFGVPFLSLKFITDGANGHAASEWSKAVEMAAERLATALEAATPHLT
ncbi:hypothetical protein P2318_09150 [Myxococcaceae bacterium GXIMD 01537]